jgi:oligopeptide transport system permease protein
MVITLFAVATLTFFMMRAIPGDPLATMARALPEQIRANYMAKYGLDKPLIEQYWLYIKGLLRFDLGESLQYHGRTVAGIIGETSVASARVGSVALFLGLCLGIFAGIAAALRKNTAVDYVVMVIAILGMTVPVFLMAALLQFLFSVTWHLLPTSGWGQLKHMVLPVIVLSFGTIATYARYIKSSVLDTLSQDYITTARAYGLSERQVVFRHVLRNSITPSITILATSIVGIFTGSFVVESIFGIPGMGYYFVKSVTNNDYTMVLGVTVFYAALFIVVQFTTDILYTLIDPRVRVGGLNDN